MSVSAGAHILTVEYFETSGGAIARVDATRAKSVGAVAAEYFDGLDFTGKKRTAALHSVDQNWYADRWCG